MSFLSESTRRPTRAAKFRIGSAITEVLEPRQLFSALPAGYQEADIGNTGTAGSTNFDATTGRFTIVGGGNFGTDLFGPSDAFHFVYTTLTGDGQITARVSSVTSSDKTTPSGLVIRSSLSASAAESFVGTRPDNVVVVNRRDTDGTLGENVFSQAGTSPEYLRLVRTGNVINAYESTDGVNFSQINNTTITTLGATAYIGLAVSSSSPAITSTAVFDNLSSQPVSAVVTSAPPISLPHPDPYQFSVTYSGNTAVRASSLNDNNIVVAGPGGYTANATLVSTGLSDAQSIVATYSVPGPTSNGQYTISVGTSPVTNTLGAATSAGVLGSFAVSSPVAVISGRVVSGFSLSGIAGRTVFIDANNNGALDTGEQSTQTDATGSYSFVGLLPQTYRIAEVLPTGVKASDPAVGFKTVELTAAQLSGAASFAELPAALPAGTAGSNLSVSITGIPGSAVSGSAGKIKLIVTNAGSTTVQGPLSIALQLSSTGALSPSDSILKTMALTKSFKLAAHKSKTYTIAFKYPTGLATGKFYLAGIVDSGSAIAETNKADNVNFSGPITIGPKFSFLAVKLGTVPSSIVHGKRQTINVTANNIGNNTSGSYVVSLYESADQAFDSSDVLLGKGSGGSLKAATSKGLAIHFTTSTTKIHLGSEYILAVLTSKANNNTVATPTTILFS